MSNAIRQLCTAPTGEVAVLQGNIAFAVGCVRGGVHAADGYPGTPSTEVIDRGLSEVQDLITVGWSVNEAVASRGRDRPHDGGTRLRRHHEDTRPVPGRGCIHHRCVVRHVPRAHLCITSPATSYRARRSTPSTPATSSGAVSYPSSSHAITRRCTRQPPWRSTSAERSELRWSSCQAACSVTARDSVRMMQPQSREPVEVTTCFREFNALPNMARANYNRAVTERDARADGDGRAEPSQPLGERRRKAGRHHLRRLRHVRARGQGVARTRHRRALPRVHQPAADGAHHADSANPYDGPGLRHRGWLPLHPGEPAAGRIEGAGQDAERSAHRVDSRPGGRTAGPCAPCLTEAPSRLCRDLRPSVPVVPTGSSPRKWPRCARRGSSTSSSAT